MLLKVKTRTHAQTYWQELKLQRDTSHSSQINHPKSVRSKSVERVEEKREKRPLRPYDEEYRRELPSTA